jgi:hypothetical protein
LAQQQQLLSVLKYRGCSSDEARSAAGPVDTGAAAAVICCHAQQQQLKLPATVITVAST